MVPGPDDAQGSYDETVDAQWDGGSPGMRITGKINVKYHLDFWLVRQVAEATYAADGRYTFSATGKSTEVIQGVPPCNTAGSVSGSGDIAPGKGAISINYGEAGWYFKDLILPGLSDTITAIGDTCQPHDEKITGYLLNFGGPYNVQQTVPRIVVFGEAGSSERNCDKLNEESMTTPVIPTFFAMPDTGVRCSIHHTFKFTGRLKTTGPGAGPIVDPFGNGAQPCRRKPAKAGETPGPCITPTPGH